MKESAIQKEIMNMLKEHPRVVWCYVTSAGYVRGIQGGMRFKVGFDGMSDILGQLRDGRLFAIEVKRPGKKPTELQQEFIDMVNNNGGVANWVDNLMDAMQLIEITGNEQ
jgi:hypothetical protein